MRARLDRADELSRERPRAEDQHPIGERSVAHDGVADRADRQKQSQDHEQARKKWAFGYARVRKERVEAGEQDHRDAEGLEESRGETAQAPDHAEIVQVVVVERY